MLGKDGPLRGRVGAWTEQGGWVDSTDFIFNDGSSVPPDDGLVASCPAGTYLFEDRECLACPAGTFQPTDENVGDEPLCYGVGHSSCEGGGANRRWPCAASSPSSVGSPAAPLRTSRSTYATPSAL